MITNQVNYNHYKEFEKRQLRTDDIQGAQPKKWGNAVPLKKYAGVQSGLVSTYKNESNIFNMGT